MIFQIASAVAVRRVVHAWIWSSAVLAASPLCFAAVLAPTALVTDAGVKTSPAFRMEMIRNGAGVPEPSPPGTHTGVAARPGLVLINPASGASAIKGLRQGAPRLAASMAGMAASTASGAAGGRPGAIEDLRRRLVERLGASSASDSKYTLRVANRGESGENIVSAARPSGAQGARRAGVRTTPHAAARAESAVSAPLPSEWAYDGPSGPDAWARLRPEYGKCASGTRQSPIDIGDGVAVDLEPIAVDYHPSAFSVIDTGRMLQVQVEPGNAITVAGRRYELRQVHFHTPSEERIGGRQFDMSMHLEHQDAQGRLATVAVLLERADAHAVIQLVLNNLPLEKGEEIKAREPIDLAKLLPEDRRYYTYMGSQTTPPCGEGMLWLVMKQPVALSAQQMAIFKRIYPMNARPVQPMAGRLIKQSN